jgi:glycosyltransferase involved in cell wall biosynthesis
MRLLCVSHTATVAGAEHSLLVLLRHLPDGVGAVLACPEGELARAARALGIDVRPIPGTDLSGRLHPRHTAREAIRLLRSGRDVVGIARDWGADVVHANTPRAGLVCAAAVGTGIPLVVHVRDSLPPGRVPGVTLSVLARRASAFVCTSRFLAEQLPRRAATTIVANAVESGRFDPSRLSRAESRARLGLRDDVPAVALVAQISPHKGQSDAIRALALVRRHHPRARLLLVGSVKFTSSSTRFDNRSYRAELERLVHDLGLGEAVSFLGERPDIPELLAAADLLLVPSWYEPFGRVAVEAMMMKVPVIATSVGGVREVVADGVDGLIRDPRDAAAWAQAIGSLLDDPVRRREMGERGRSRAVQAFSPSRHAAAMLDVFERALPERRMAPSGPVPGYALQSSGSGIPPHG